MTAIAPPSTGAPHQYVKIEVPWGLVKRRFWFWFSPQQKGYSYKSPSPPLVDCFRSLTIHFTLRKTTMLESQSSPRSSPAPSPRAPQMFPVTANDVPISSPASSSARSPQEGTSADHLASTYAPAMSTIRSPHLTTTPNPIIAASFAASSDNYRSAAISVKNPVPSTGESVPPPAYTPSASTNSFASTSPLTPSRPTSTPVVIAVADRFLDETSRIRLEQPQQQHQQNRYSRQPTGTTNIQIIEATPVHFRPSGSCMTRRAKIAAFMMLVAIIVLSVLGGTVWRHDDKSDNYESGPSKPTKTGTNPTATPSSSPSSSPPTNATTTTSSAGAPTPTTGSSDPWGPCKPGGCLNFVVACKNGCTANDPTYKSCYAACNGEFFCQSDCTSPQKNSCFGTCTSQSLTCLQQCGN